MKTFSPSLEGITGVLHSSSDIYTNSLAETIAPLLASILEKSEYTHVVSSHSSNAKNIIPRLSGVLGVPSVSDVMSVSHSPSENTTTFTRPIYAGNAIATIKAPGSLHTKIFTVRSTAFAKASSSAQSSSVEVSAVDPINVSDVPTTHVQTIIAKSDRPELGTASRVVSGGRALKNAATFKETLDPLADALGAAVGASRAAVDAGYADNSLQVVCPWRLVHGHPHSPVTDADTPAYRLGRQEKWSLLNCTSLLVSAGQSSTWRE